MNVKHFLPALLFLSTALPGLAQSDKPDPVEKKSPHLIVLAGIQYQWFDPVYQVATFCVERPTSHYWNYGLVGGYYEANRNDYGYDYYGSQFLGGFETGVYAKYFFHGRFSGHKSGLYVGPEMRLGSRRYQYYKEVTFPIPSNPTTAISHDKTTKILIRWGMHWQFGHANLELSAPFGWETSRYKEPYGFGNKSQFILLPTLQLGVAF